MQLFSFRAEQPSVMEWTETVILKNVSSKTVSDTTFKQFAVVVFRGKQFATDCVFGDEILSFFVKIVIQHGLTLPSFHSSFTDFVTKVTEITCK